MQMTSTSINAATDTGSATIANIITVIRDPKHPLGKRITLNADGSISKQAAVSISFGIATMHRVNTHDDLSRLFEQVGNDPHAAIINSSFEGIEIEEEFIILSEREIEARLSIPKTDRTKQKGVHTLIHDGKTYKAVGRFKENVRPSCWQYFDRDIDRHTPAKFSSMTHAEWLSEVSKFCPRIAEVSYVHVGSTSSRVLLDGKPVGGGNGHTWVKFEHPEDIERFRTAVMIAAAQAEMTWLKPRYSRSDAGKVVGNSLTTIIDPSVFTPGRLTFIGKPVVSGGLTVEPLSVRSSEGKHSTFDSTTVKLPDASAVREITRKAGSEMDITEGGSGLRIKANNLTLDMELETEDLGTLSVRELVKRGIGSKVRCQTPFRDSTSFAAFLSIGAGGLPFVHDAGTCITHWLAQSEVDECHLETALGKINRMLDKAKSDCGAPFEADSIEALREIQNRQPADFQRIRSELKRCNKDISVVNLDKALKTSTVIDQVVAQTHHGYAKDVAEKFTVGKFKPVGHGGKLFKVEAKNSLWVEVPPSDIIHQVTHLHDGKENCQRGSDYRSIGQHAITISTNDEYFEDAPVGLATPDGFYRIENNEIKTEPLTPNHRQRVMIDVSPKEMPTPLFDSFLHDTFKSERPDEEEEQIALMQEITGAIMTGIMHKYQKAVKYYDPFGRAGKGTIERIQRQLVPPAFQSAVSPFRWDGEYYLATLTGSRLNVVGELPDDKPIPAAAFKTVIGGDLLTGRHPTHRPFSFKNEAGHLFMSNHFVNTTDHSEAFYARWIIVEFPNSRLVSGLHLDPNLAERIIQEELPGIAFWGLKGAARLLDKGGFSKSKAHDRLMTLWRRRANSVDEFIHDCCELGEGLIVKRAQFYQVYTAWCKENGRKPFSKSKVKELLEFNTVHGIKHSTLDGNEVFRGVHINPAAVSNIADIRPLVTFNHTPLRRNNSSE